ncbi:MAG: hypothetical protein K6U75_10445 [Firmicutes bacterium]|nr:hypothetical protein [Bacillota bacterium]
MDVIKGILEQIRSLDVASVERTVTLGYYLHNFYSAMEDLFAEIASTFENRIESPTAYHRELVRRMAMEIPTIRPPVLSAPSAILLDELRAFRHVFRHSYNYTLDPERVSSLRHKLLANWDSIEQDLLRFERFLWEQLQSE